MFFGGATVVAGENDERILFDAAATKLSEHLAHAVIEMRKHGGFRAELPKDGLPERFGIVTAWNPDGITTITLPAVPTNCADDGCMIGGVRYGE